MLEVERDQMAHNSNSSRHDVMSVLFYTNSEFDILCNGKQYLAEMLLEALCSWFEISQANLSENERNMVT